MAQSATNTAQDDLIHINVESQLDRLPTILSFPSGSEEDPSITTSGSRSFPSTSTTQSTVVFTPAVANTIHGDAVRLVDLPGMGLPIELWFHTISLLARDAMSLLSCASTCRYLRDPAQRLIDKSHKRTIDPAGYDDLDELVQEIRNSPGHAKAIHHLFVEGKEESGLVALSAIPTRLSRQLMSLRQLSLMDSGFNTNYQLHPSTWMLYGRAFPSVTNLELAFVHFDSFNNFADLITSFPVLHILRVRYLRLGNHALPFGVTRGFSKRHMRLQELSLQDDETSLFLTPFIQWLFQGVFQVQHLILHGRATFVAGHRLLLHLRERLQDLTLGNAPGEACTTEDVRRLAGEKWPGRLSNVVLTIV